MNALPRQEMTKPRGQKRNNEEKKVVIKPRRVVTSMLKKSCFWKSKKNIVSGNMSQMKLLDSVE